MIHAELTERVIRSEYAVHNTLGAGFLESVYERSLVIELRQAGLQVALQVPLDVYYREECVGQFLADLVVEQLLIVEPKAVERLVKAHEVQLVNYLTATDCQSVCC